MTNNWKQILKKFNSKDRVDIFQIINSNDNTKQSTTIYKHRGELPKDKTTYINILSTKPHKQLSEYQKINLFDPWTSETLKQYTKTNVQEIVNGFVSKTIRYYGNFALSCPCGSGKTLAGISLISKLGVQTLIISTRCAINDQWRDTLLKIYNKSKLTIKTNDAYYICSRYSEQFEKIKNKDKSDNSRHVDIFIYSPQYLIYDDDINNRWPNTAGLIIYDEIHSQLSSEYNKVLLQPFKNVINKVTTELPCMLGLSATYPASGEYKDIINKIFGNILSNSSKITDIPVNYYDLRDEYHLNHSDKYDKNYEPIDDYEFIDNILDNKYEYFNEYIEPTINQQPTLCGFVITTTVKSSVYAWLMFHKKYKNKRCILIREGYNGCYLLTDTPPDDIYKLEQLVDLEDIVKHPRFKNFCKKIETYTNSDILFGTYHRLKEGISVENAVWAICSKFLWSTSVRVQLLGRIRRMTNSELINNYPRYFLTVSGKIPTNIGEYYKWRKFHKGGKAPTLQITYNVDVENEVFKRENYINYIIVNNNNIDKTDNKDN